jgi:hypothetical protein
LNVNIIWEESEHNPDSVGMCMINFSLTAEVPGFAGALIAGWTPSSPGWTDEQVLQQAEMMIPRRPPQPKE